MMLQDREGKVVRETQSLICVGLKDRRIIEKGQEKKCLGLEEVSFGQMLLLYSLAAVVGSGVGSTERKVDRLR